MLPFVQSITRRPLVRFALRRSRQHIFKILGRAPICRLTECVSVHRDRSIVAALNRSEQFTPSLIRTDGDLELWSTIAGDVWMPSMRLDNVRKLTGEVAYDAYDLAGVADRVNGGVVLDCGANVGLFAMAALRAGASRVICFEPAPRTLEALRRNLAQAIEGGRALIVPEAISGSPGRADFEIIDGECGSNRLGSTGQRPTVPVQVTSVDAYVAEAGLDRVDFIKMDIEGAEAEAMRGASQTLRRFAPIVAVATEHTADVLENTRTVLSNAPSSYGRHCLECHAQRSPEHGLVLTPFVIQLRPATTATADWI